MLEGHLLCFSLRDNFDCMIIKYIGAETFVKFECDCGYVNAYNVSPSPDEGYMVYEGDLLDSGNLMHWIKCKDCFALWIFKRANGEITKYKYIPYDASNTL